MPQLRYYAEVAEPAPFQSFCDLGHLETILASGITGGELTGGDLGSGEKIHIASSLSILFLLLSYSLVVVFWKNCLSLPSEFLIEVCTALE